ncbi:MAG TPA: hypothetical protein P5335_11235, partial [Flavobacterium sp.]|nr:hypothetical protein [Flavobacterium sp.]HRZ75498.1 hypothetical protein [Flavobacterium sp.]
LSVHFLSWHCLFLALPTTPCAEAGPGTHLTIFPEAGGLAFAQRYGLATFISTFLMLPRL